MPPADGEQGPLLRLLDHPLAWLFGGGGATLLVKAFIDRRKGAAEAATTEEAARSTAADSAIRVADSIERRLTAANEWIATLQEKNTELYFHNQRLRQRISALETIIAAAGLTIPPDSTPG